MKKAMGVTLLPLLLMATSCAAMHSERFRQGVQGANEGVREWQQAQQQAQRQQAQALAAEAGMPVAVPAPKSAPACPMSVECPIHRGYVASYTGSRTVDGVFVGVYQCPFVSEDHERGHDVVRRCN